MYFLSYWEIFGIVLVTLYFVLSLLFPKTKDSEKEQQKPKDEDAKGTSIASLNKEREKAPEKPAFTSQENISLTEGRDDSCSVVSSSNTHCESTSQQEVNTVLHKSNSSSSKLKETICFSEDNVLRSPEVASASVEVAPIEPLQVNLSETSYDEKLSELTDDSVSSLKEPQESLENKIEHDVHVVKDERNDQETCKPDEYPSKYLYMEFKNGTEGLPPNDVSIARISDSTDKSCENISSREIHSSELEHLPPEDLSSPVKVENMNLADGMATPLNSQNNNNLEKFAYSLASSTIETAVDNSVCLSNFAENLSEKIFWASADDVISEVHANIEKQNEKSLVNKGVLKPVKLESLSSNVASEVVNEAIGEAALKEEYMSDEEQDVVSPQRIHPHIGYVVENVVNNAICEAALKIKREEDENIDETTDNTEDSQILYESKSHDVSTLPESSAETVILSQVIDTSRQQEQSTELLKSSEEDQRSETIEINYVEKDSTLERNEDQQSQSVAVEIPTEEAQEIKSEIKGHVNDTHIEQETSTEPAKSYINDESYEPTEFHHEEKESESDRPEDQQSQSTTVETVTKEVQEIESEGSGHVDTKRIDTEKVIDEDDYSANESITSLPSESQIVAAKERVDVEEGAEKEAPLTDDGKESEQVKIIENEDSNAALDVDDIKIETSEQADTEDKADEVSEQIEDETEIKTSLVLQKESDLNGETDNNNDSESCQDSISIPEIKLFTDKDRSESIESEENIVSPVSLPDQSDKVTLRDKVEENKDSFWRRSLILDLEEDFDLEESLSSDATSPDSPKPIQQPLSNEESEDFSDSEEDEIIDHDSDAKLGAVGGSQTTTQNIEEDDFDFYDYGSDDDEQDSLFEPVLTVDGLCVSKQTDKGSKRKGNLKSGEYRESDNDDEFL